MRAVINLHYFNIPIGNMQVFEFQVSNPELAVMTMEIYDQDVTTSEFIAFSAIPISCMRMGLRHCSLYDEKGVCDGEFVFASLTVRIFMQYL